MTNTAEIHTLSYHEPPLNNTCSKKARPRCVTASMVSPCSTGDRARGKSACSRDAVLPVVRRDGLRRQGAVAGNLPALGVAIVVAPRLVLAAGRGQLLRRCIPCGAVEVDE